MKVLLLAAGYATRLYPLTLNRPKPLLPIQGRPVIEFILDNIKILKEVDEVFIVTNQKFYQLFKEWSHSFVFSKHITIINDGTTSNENRLGATGDINFVIEMKDIKDDLMVLAGDNLFRADLSRFIDFCDSNRPFITIGVYDIGDLELAKIYGIVVLGEDKKILEFSEKPKRPMSTLAAMCLYFFPSEKLGVLKEYAANKAAKDAPGYFLEWLHKREDIYGYVFRESPWFDIGDRNSYEEANKKFGSSP